MKPLNILIIEDSEDDMLLLLRELRRGGYEPVFERVETAEAMQAALAEKSWDIIVSDYVLPRFSGIGALAVLKKSGLDLPFIIVSGNIGEETAVAAMKAGAHDYLIKGRLARLVPAVERELREAAGRRERRRLESIKKEKEFIDAVLNSTKMLVTVLDRAGRIVIFNRACQHLTGYCFKEVKDRPFRAIFLTAGVVTEEVLPAGRIPDYFGDHLLTKAGECRCISWSTATIKDDQGSVEFIIGTGLDITARQQVEEELAKYRRHLEKLVEERTAELKLAYDQLLHAEKLSAIGKLSASIAHELNNPLFGIRNVLAGIKRRTALEEVDLELVILALQECDRIKYLIQGLRDFHRPTSGVMALMDLHQAIDGTLLLLKKEFKNKKIKVEKHFAPDTPPILAVSDQIKQVLLNFLKNAVDAIPEGGGNIMISTENLGKQVAVRVRDSGEGIKPENMGHIFEPFFTTKPEVKGTGLGLSVSHGIIHKHGGRIEVESEVGQGSTFTIFLPVNLMPCTESSR